MQNRFEMTKWYKNKSKYDDSLDLNQYQDSISKDLSKNTVVLQKLN